GAGRIVVDQRERRLPDPGAAHRRGGREGAQRPEPRGTAAAILPAYAGRTRAAGGDARLLAADRRLRRCAARRTRDRRGVSQTFDEGEAVMSDQTNAPAPASPDPAASAKIDAFLSAVEAAMATAQVAERERQNVLEDLRAQIAEM